MLILFLEVTGERIQNTKRLKGCLDMFLRNMGVKSFRPDRILEKLYWMLIFDVWSISSKLDADKKVKVIFADKGSELNKNYFCSLIFKEDHRENYMGKVWVWSLIYYFWRFRKDHDLIIVKTKMKICNLFKSKSRFVIPDWISCEIDLKGDLLSQSIAKRSLKNNIKKMKKGNFEYSISKDPNDFQFFYTNMYLPYILNRHGDLGLKVSFEKMQKGFENGELLFIKDEGEIIAGVIIDYKVMNGIPRATQLGVLRGDFNYVKKGALVAIYYYTIEYLRERNFGKFSVGLARPFINDGMLNHKLYWGANIVCETSRALLLCILSQRKYVKDLLFDNPFIFKDKNRLKLATFTNGNSNEFKKFDKYRKKIDVIELS